MEDIEAAGMPENTSEGHASEEHDVSEEHKKWLVEELLREKRESSMGEALYYFAAAVERDVFSRGQIVHYLRQCSASLGFSTTDDHLDRAFEEKEVISIPPPPALTGIWRKKYLKDKKMAVIFATESDAQACVIPFSDDIYHYVRSADHMLSSYERFLDSTGLCAKRLELGSFSLFHLLFTFTPRFQPWWLDADRDVRNVKR